MSRIALVAGVFFCLMFAAQAHAQSAMGYDAVGRLKCVKYPSGKVTTYNYDTAGNRTSVVTAASGTCGSDAGGTSAPTPPATIVLTSLDPANTLSSAATLNLAAALLGSSSDSATLSVVGAATGGASGTCGTSSFTSTQLSYTAPTLTTGAPNLTCWSDYTLQHSNGQQQTGRATYTVTAPTGGGGGGGSNGAPTANDDFVDITMDLPTPGHHVTPTGAFTTLRSNDTDPDSDPLTITAVTNGALGTVAIGGGGTSVTYTLGHTVGTEGFSDSDSFTYTISDGHGHTSTATVTVTITVGSLG
jgi:YD repeat-containing protein